MINLNVLEPSGFEPVRRARRHGADSLRRRGPEATSVNSCCVNSFFVLASTADSDDKQQEQQEKQEQQEQQEQAQPHPLASSPLQLLSATTTTTDAKLLCGTRENTQLPMDVHSIPIGYLPQDPAEGQTGDVEKVINKVHCSHCNYWLSAKGFIAVSHRIKGLCACGFTALLSAKGRVRLTSRASVDAAKCASDLIGEFMVCRKEGFTAGLLLISASWASIATIMHASDQIGESMSYRKKGFTDDSHVTPACLARIDAVVRAPDLNGVSVISVWMIVGHKFSLWFRG